jgi:guanosine-3',5'-bis(diphosphate) 3'-pyrophosphohydrolase
MYNCSEILNTLTSHNKYIDKSLIEKAISFTIKYHKDQLRDSGDPYYTHPIEVAKIVADMNLDTATIITALLHDTIEDTDLTFEEIKKHFGSEIAGMVDGVTKLKKVKLNLEQVNQAENFRKLFLAMVEDIRVLLVKLADRLHNMRTITFKSEEKRRKISLETLEIYAPLAERIGVNKIKHELQDIALCNLYPDIYTTIIRKLEEISNNTQVLIQQIIKELSELLNSQGLEAEVFGRAKSPYSIWMKMVNKNTSFDDLSDVIGFRVLVKSTQECYRVLGIIHSEFRTIPGSFSDFISMPKDNGYQSLHTVVIGPLQRKIEMQIRTYEMHDIAELGLAAHWCYKQQYKATDVKNYQWIREMVSILEHSSSSEELLQHTKLAMYHNQVFCLTPKGDIISLPKKATTIDFAYAVHSKVGNHCIGAKINGKLSPLRSELKTGDIVEILISSNQNPSSSWEDFAITGKAKSEIKRFLKHQNHEESIRLGKNLIENAFLSAKISNFDKALDNIALKLNKSREELYLNVGIGQIPTSEIVNLSNLKPLEPKSIFRLSKARDDSSSHKVPISELIPGILVHFPKCCNPIPGDQIIGIVYTGKGVTIHTNECKIGLQLQSSTEKIFNLSWDTSDSQTRYNCKIKMITHSDNNIISIITSQMARYNINLINLQIKKIDQFFNEINCDIEVNNSDALNNLIQSLKTEKLVYSIIRARS